MIISIGHIICDIYAYDEDSYLAIEADPLLNTDRYNCKKFLGGKAANVAQAASMVSDRVHISCSLGNDKIGKNIKSTLLKSGIGFVESVETEGGTDCIVYKRYEFDEEGCYLDFGSNKLYTLKNPDSYKCTSGDYIVMHNTAPRKDMHEFLGKVRKMGVKTAYTPSPDTAGLTDDFFCNIDYLFMNLDEADIIRSGSGKGLDMKEYFLYLSGLYKNTIAITMGAKGVLAFREGVCTHKDCHAVETVDCVGAGDSLLGTTIGLLSNGYDFPEALNHGITVATRKCTLEGAQGIQI